MKTREQKLELCKKHIEWFALCGAISFVGMLGNLWYGIGVVLFGGLAAASKIVSSAYEED